MGSIGVGLGLELGNRHAPASVFAPPTLRIVPVSATKAYVIAPHPTMGAAALQLIYGNQGDSSTPSGSIGAPFGGWRIGGYALLDSVDDDPTSPRELIYSGIGSHDYAVQAHDSGLFGGCYHGGLQNYAQTIPDPTTAAMIAGFAQHHGADVTWPDGQIAVVTDDFSLTAEGAIESRVTIYFPHDTYCAYPDLIVVGAGFTRASLDGADYIDIGTVSDDIELGSSETVAFRNPTTGTVVTVSDNATSLPSFKSKFLVRGSDQTKYYANFDTASQGNLGLIDVSRTISFSASEPDPPPPPSSYVWNGADGDSGYAYVTNGVFGGTTSGGQLSFANGRLIFTRGGGAGSGPYARVSWAMTGLVSGLSYTVAVSDVVTGGSPSGGTTFGVSTSSNGASGTTLAAVTNGTNAYSFTATASTMYFYVNQIWTSGSTDTLHIGSIGPITTI